MLASGRHIGCLVIGLLLLASCSQWNVRKDVPVGIGITLDEGCDSTSIQNTVASVKELNADVLLVEIPFQVEELQSFENASDFKYYESHPLEYLLEMLKEDSISYQLSFVLENPQRKSTDQVNLGDYFSEISGILLRSNAYKPFRISFYGEFFQDDESILALNKFVQQVREAIPSVQGNIYYGVQAELLDETFEWEVPDGISLVYVPGSFEGKAKHYYELNKRVGELAVAKEKPLMILRTNLLGDRKYKEFLLQLSYWPEEVRLEGINLNTLYCETAFLDEESPFALAKEFSLKRYLQNR
ncbi:MAG: hypothetical protein AAGC85_16220 [Bacteroidota bacterium]